MDDLDLFMPTPRLVRTRAGEVSVLPLTFEVFGAFARSTEKSGALLMAGDYITALRQHEADVRQMVALGTGKPAAFVGPLYADDIIRLVTAVVEVNTDFFIQCIAPAMAVAEKVAMQQLLKITLAGTSSLPSSEPAATH